MSAQIETLLDSYANAANQNKSKSTSQQTNSNTASSFSNLLKEKLTGTVSLNRLEKQLAIPDTTKPADQDLSIQDQRPADRTDLDQERDPVEAAAAPARYEDNSQPRAQEKSAAPRDAGTEKAAAPQENRETGQNASGQGNQNSAKNNDGTAASNQAKATKQAEATGNNATDVLKGQEKTQEKIAQDFGSLNSNAKKSNSAIKATVTTQAAQVTSQPTNNLASATNVKAEIAGQAKAATAGQQDMAGNSGGDLAKGTPFEQTEGGSLAVKAGKAKAEAGAANNAAKTTQNANAQNANQPNPALNFNNAVAAAQTNTGAAQNTANMAGSSGQTVTVDAATGSTTVMGQNGSVQRNAAPAAARNAGPNVPPKVIADQVAVNIQRAAGLGQDQISIQLRPQELGRIEVKMEMGQDGRMTAVISAERPETLDMLRNDSRSLIQSLNDAGLQTDANSLSFNLKGQNGDGQQQTASNNGKSSGEESGFNLDGEGGVLEDEPMLAEGEDAVADENGRMNIRV